MYPPTASDIHVSSRRSQPVSKPPAIAQRVRDNVEAPALVWFCRHQHRPPCADSTFATPALAYRQAFFLVDAIQLLVIELDAFTFQHQTDPAIPEPATLRRDLAHALT